MHGLQYLGGQEVLKKISQGGSNKKSGSGKQRSQAWLNKEVTEASTKKLGMDKQISQGWLSK